MFGAVKYINIQSLQSPIHTNKMVHEIDPGTV